MNIAVARRRVGRVLAITLTLVVLLVGLSSCGLLPSRPDLSGPVSLTVVDDSLAFVQCVAAEVDVYAVNLTIHDETESDGETWRLISADSGGTLAATIPAELPVTAKTLEGDFRRTGEENVKVSALRGELSVFLKIVGDQERVEQSFPSVQVSDLAPGAYVYSSGEVSDDPCGMPGAFE